MQHLEIFLGHDNYKDYSVYILKHSPGFRGSLLST